MDCAETDNQDKESIQRADKEPSNSSEELYNWPEIDEEPEVTEKSLYLEPPDVQRQLNHYTLMAQADAPSQTNVQEAILPDNSLLHCEFCNFNTGHLSSMRRHYLNRHGKKFLRCKDCEFFTGLRKTLEMHMERGHSTCQSEPTHQKDLRCPFCLYQTKNKNNMIDHIILHREERVVPIEVRRSKLSRYLQGIVFRCHKCTFTCGSAENLRLHMTRHDDIKPYKCRLCYFDCTQLSDLEAHLSDKHQVVRNHELVGQVSLDQLQARVGRMPEEEEEPSSNLGHNNNSEDVKTEELVTDCNEVPHETQAKNHAENNMREKFTLQTKEAYQKQEQDSKNEESPVKSSVLDLQYEDAKPNTAVKEKRNQDQHKQAVVFLSALPKRRESENSSTTFTQQKEEATDGSSATYGKIAKKAAGHKLHIKALQQRMLDIDARVEDDILHHILLLDDDGSIRQTHKKADQDNIETEVADNVRSKMTLLDEKGSITLAHNSKNQANTEVVSALAKKNVLQVNNSRAQESFTAQKHLLTSPPKCDQISHEESLGVSFTNCKKEEMHTPKNSEEFREIYGEMPVLENEYLKQEMQPLSCCKEDLKLKQDREDEMITEDDESRCTNQKHEEGDGMKKAGNPHVPKGALTVTDEAVDVLCPAATEAKPFTCKFCGRNLMNSSELTRHIMRHGL